MHLLLKLKGILILILIICITGFCIIGCPDEEHDSLYTIGHYGSNIGEFNLPSGIMLMRVTLPLNLCLFVADYGNNRIQLIPLSHVESTLAFGGLGTGDGQFNGPISVAVTRSVLSNSNASCPDSIRIYVADSRNHRIQKFDLNGKFLLKWGQYGNGNGEFNTPTGIDVDFDGYVYVVDSGNNRVQVFDTIGNFIRMWGQYGPEPGQFISPIDIGVIFYNDDKSFRALAVTDNGNNRIQIYDRLGNLIKIIENIPAPLGISSSFQSVVQFVEAQHKVLYIFSFPDCSISTKGLFEIGSPYDVDNFFVTDHEKHRIAKYTFK
jgi:hypothetical protein